MLPQHIIPRFPQPTAASRLHRGLSPAHHCRRYKSVYVSKHNKSLHVTAKDIIEYCESNGIISNSSTWCSENAPSAPNPPAANRAICGSATFAPPRAPAFATAAALKALGSTGNSKTVRGTSWAPRWIRRDPIIRTAAVVQRREGAAAVACTAMLRLPEGDKPSTGSEGAAAKLGTPHATATFAGNVH